MILWPPSAASLSPSHQTGMYWKMEWKVKEWIVASESRKKKGKKGKEKEAREESVESSNKEKKFHVLNFFVRWVIYM